MNFQTKDQLMTNRLLDRKSKEWRINMWVATIDFAKAFDTSRCDKEISQDLKPASHTTVFQRATVWTDTESDDFNVARVSKQGGRPF